MGVLEAIEGRFLRAVDRREPGGSGSMSRRLGEGHRVATVQVDSGLRHLAGHLYETTTRRTDDAIA